MDPAMRAILAATDSKEACRADGVPEEARGRLEKRDCDVIDTTRSREVIKADSKCLETVYGLTSLAPGRAGGNCRPGAPAPGNREQGAGPTGFTSDEDLCRACVRNLAVLSNTAPRPQTARTASLPPSSLRLRRPKTTRSRAPAQS